MHKQLSDSQINSLFSSPDIYPLQLDMERGIFTAISMCREDYLRSPFHDMRLLSENTIAYASNIDPLLERFQSHIDLVPRCNFIFHSAFCGSTLLSRYLDELGGSFVYREPMALMLVAHYKHIGFQEKNPERWDAYFRFILGMLSRTYNPDDISTIKAHDNCNLIAQELLSLNSEAAGIALYSSLKTFLLSTLKVKSRRSWARDRLNSTDRSLCSEINSLAIDQLTDSQVIVCLWIVQMHTLIQALESHNTQLYSVNSKTFFSQPEKTLSAVAKHFNLAHSPESISQAVKIVSAVHAKTGNKISQSNIENRTSELAKQHAEEIKVAIKWGQPLLLKHPVPAELPNPLPLAD